MPTGSVQDDRRTRRRFVLLWSGAVVVAFAVFVAGGQTLGRDTHDPAPTIDADGTGTALVLDAPPVDIDPDPNGVPAAVAGDPGTLQVQPKLRSLASESSTGNSALSPPRPHGVRLQLTSTLSAPLRPGTPRTLHVRVRNPNGFVVNLFRLDVRVLPSPVAGCLTSWVRTGRYRYAGGKPIKVGARAVTYVDLPIQLVNLVDVNQNACQNTAFPLNLSGIAVDPT